MAKRTTQEVHPDETDEHFSEFLRHLSTESERGCILVTGAWLDELLDRLLRAHMVDAPDVAEELLGLNRPGGTFSARIDLCFMFGLISQGERHDLHIIREIRNRAAHFDYKRGHGFSAGFSSSFVKAKVDALRLPSQKYRATISDSREVFTSGAGVIWCKLMRQIELTHHQQAQGEDVMFAVQFDSPVFIQMSEWMVQGRANKAMAEAIGRRALGVPEDKPPTQK